MRVSSAAVLHLRAVEAMSVTVVVERFLLPVEPLRMLLNTWVIRHANGSWGSRCVPQSTLTDIGSHVVETEIL